MASPRSRPQMPTTACWSLSGMRFRTPRASQTVFRSRMAQSPAWARTRRCRPVVRRAEMPLPARGSRLGLAATGRRSWHRPRTPRVSSRAVRKSRSSGPWMSAPQPQASAAWQAWAWRRLRVRHATAIAKLQGRRRREVPLRCPPRRCRPARAAPPLTLVAAWDHRQMPPGGQWPWRASSPSSTTAATAARAPAPSARSRRTSSRAATLAPVMPAAAPGASVPSRAASTSRNQRVPWARSTAHPQKGQRCRTPLQSGRSRRLQQRKARSLVTALLGVALCAFGSSRPTTSGTETPASSAMSRTHMLWCGRAAPSTRRRSSTMTSTQSGTTTMSLSFHSTLR
mmetsp:Transcript_18804/g.41294  ORF Transcript_18804/g.41294 Transcript_18804/m.41294 type:complete len:341 (+) Transcript_18804:1686-2708(+)